MEILSQISASDGIYGAEGTHDNYSELFAAMQQYSTTPLSDSGTYISGNFYLAGSWISPEPQTWYSKGSEGSTARWFCAYACSQSGCCNDSGYIISWFDFMRTYTRQTDYTVRSMRAWINAAQNHNRIRAAFHVRTGTIQRRYSGKGTGRLSSVPGVFARPQVIVTMTAE